MNEGFEVYGVGNGIVDILVSVTEDQFRELELTKGGMTLVSEEDQRGVLRSLGDARLILTAGGSAANTIVGLAQLGARAALSCTLGSDDLGDHYAEDLGALGIERCGRRLPDAMTGSCLVLITPDAERTMNTCLAAASALSVEDIDEAKVARSSWLYLEGYLLSAPVGRDAVRCAIEAARRAGTKIAVSCSDSFIINGFREAFEEMAGAADLLFANEQEAMTLTGRSHRGDAFTTLRASYPGAVMTAGPDGAFLWWNGEEAHVEAVPTKPVDLTGAGDIFAAGFLYTLMNGIDIREGARASCYLASKVISQVGARLDSGVTGHWREGVARTSV